MARVKCSEVAQPIFEKMVAKWGLYNFDEWNVRTPFDKKGTKWDSVLEEIRQELEADGYEMSVKSIEDLIGHGVGKQNRVVKNDDRTDTYTPAKRKAYDLKTDAAYKAGFITIADVARITKSRYQL